MEQVHAPKETPSEAWEEEVTPLPMFCPCKSAGQWGGVTGPTPGILMSPHHCGLQGSTYKMRTLLTGLRSPNWLPEMGGGQWALGHEPGPGLCPQAKPLLCPSILMEVLRGLGKATRADTAHMGSDSTSTPRHTRASITETRSTTPRAITTQDIHLPHSGSPGVSFLGGTSRLAALPGRP